MQNMAHNSNDVSDPVKASLLAMLQEQRDLISMMQIQLDMQKERIDKQEEEIKALQSQVKALTDVKELQLPVSSEPKAGTESGEKSHASIRDWKPESPRPEDTTVADLVKEVAEEVLAQQTDYIYDAASGLYYDQNSGYYYDPAQELFYNGHTRTYYKWDVESKTYTFHSKLPDPGEEKKKKKKEKGSKSKKCRVEQPRKKEGESIKTTDLEDVSSPKSPGQSLEEVEEGELSESEPSSGDNEGSDSDCTITSEQSSSTSSSRLKEECLPCIRAVVTESSVVGLTKGFLFLVTVMGGSVGREGSMHSILLPDPLVAKHHADIHYSTEEGKFYMTDVGSQSGTVLNGRRLADPGVTSQAEEVLHGSTVKIGSTSLLIHIHPGSLTCAMCEPGLNAPAKEPLYGPPVTKEKKESMRKKELKKLRQKYCIQQGELDALNSLPQAYTDRASVRRKVKGSDNPYEKTEVASMEESIKETNKGFKMLSKMGWKSGTSLGRTSSADVPMAAEAAAITEPIKLEMLPQRLGLGYMEEQQQQKGSHAMQQHPPLKPSVTSKSPAVETRHNRRRHGGRGEILEKTLERYSKAPATDAVPDDDNNI